MPQYGLGFDTGGTYTDAVIIDMEKGDVVCCAKSLTTRNDLSLGIAGAIKGFDKELFKHVTMVSISSTLATNSIVEGKGCRVFKDSDALDLAHIYERSFALHAVYQDEDMVAAVGSVSTDIDGRIAVVRISRRTGLIDSKTGELSIQRTEDLVLGRAFDLRAAYHPDRSGAGLLTLENVVSKSD